ncbi:alpha/beta hydrolase-fold protein [Haloferula sp.]|uniref:carboxylesterase family protein n=1 Tax=Haloferula sp. TaxID=2497595 RepID=UPI00329F1C12
MSLKRIAITLLLVCSCSTLVQGGPGTLVIDSIEPIGAESPVFNSSYNTQASGLIGVANGQSFITSTAFDLARVTMVKGTSQGYSEGNMLRLKVFAWNPVNDANDTSEWALGDGHGDGDPLDGTGMVLLFTEDYELPSGTHSEGDYLHFNLGTSLSLDANTAYGFTCEFLYGGSGADNLNYKKHNGSGGEVFSGSKQIGTTTTANTSVVNADMAFYLCDTIAGPSVSLGVLTVSTLEAIGGSALISSTPYNTSQGGSVGNSVGQSFITTDAFDMRSLTLVKGPATNYKEGNQLKLTVFSWNPPSDANDVSQWGNGDGIGDGDPVNGTGMTVLYSEFFDVPSGMMAENDYLHFDLGAAIPLAANSAYGFTSEFIYGGGGGASQLNYKRHNGSGGDLFSGGKQIGATPTANTNAGSGNLAFYLGDTLVASEVEATIVDFEVDDQFLCKLTVSTPYPALSYPRRRTNLSDPHSWWRDVPHSPDGVAPFMSTNLEYSTTDANGNYVIYLQGAGPRDFFTIGPEPTGNFESRIYDNGMNTLPYRMLKPDVYDPNVAYPLVIGFHGAGGTGTDNTSRSIEAMDHLSAKDVRSTYPAFVITPQSPGLWADTPWGEGSYDLSTTPITLSMSLVYEIIDSLELEFNIDPDRIYVTGQSMGAFGAWDCVMRQPGRFAALVPMAGGGDPTQAANLTDVAIWNFHGADDTVVPTLASQEMDAAMITAGHTNWTYTEYPGVGHAVTGPAWAEETLIPWMFSQSR